MSSFPKFTNSDGDAKPEEDLIEVKSGATHQPSNLSKLHISFQIRQACTIEIRNHHRNLQLISPSYYLYSGLNQAPPASIIAPGTSELCMFCKKLISYSGSSGLLTYDVMRIPDNGAEEKDKLGVDTRKSIAFVWSVPMVAKTMQAIGIRSQLTTSAPVFNEMLKGCKDWFCRDLAGNSLRFEAEVDGIPITCLGSMSNAGQATWTIDIC